jgi:hypothetical protein
MNQSQHTALVLAALCIASLFVDVQAATDEEVKGYATCQAWASAVHKAPASFSQEWVAWALSLQATGIASPMNDDWSPLKGNPSFRETLRTTREAFAKEPASSNSPSYKRAHEACMAHAQALSKQWKSQ